jgi:hypothetical protein
VRYSSPRLVCVCACVCVFTVPVPQANGITHRMIKCHVSVGTTQCGI